MACTTCTRGSSFRSISAAMAKAAAARLRRAGVLRTQVDWAARAEVCERCPMRVIRGSVSYCGRPFLQQVERDPVIDGCGCPTREKAKAPGEHCPLAVSHGPAEQDGDHCNCKWCAIGKADAPVRFASLSA